jgi:hypothetical protein
MRQSRQREFEDFISRPTAGAASKGVRVKTIYFSTLSLSFVELPVRLGVPHPREDLIDVVRREEQLELGEALRRLGFHR